MDAVIGPTTVRSTVGSQLSEHVGTRGVWITEMYG